MKRILVTLSKLLVVILAAATNACSKHIDAEPEPDVSYQIELLPIKTGILKGETISLSFSVKHSPYAGAAFTFCYFQPDGTGTLADDNGEVVTANQRYNIPEDGKLNLMYTSCCEIEQTLDFVFEDGFGNRKEYQVVLKAIPASYYGFRVEQLPVKNSLRQLESVNLEFSIIPNNTYAGAAYQYRYFQLQGNGMLTHPVWGLLQPNLYYDFPPESKLKLQYISMGETAHQLDFVFKDMLGNEVACHIAFEGLPRK